MVERKLYTCLTRFESVTPMKVITFNSSALKKNVHNWNVKAYTLHWYTQREDKKSDTAGKSSSLIINLLTNDFSEY